MFTRDELEQCFPSEYQESEMDLPVLDLMTSAKSYSSRGAQDTYGFLHLTIQEFLAAFWIAHHLSDDDKLSFLQRNLTENRFRMVLLFLSGLTKLKFPSASTVFSKEFWVKDKVHVCHLTYEAGNHSLCKDISHNCCNLYISRKFDKTASRFDTLVVSTFMAHSNCRWKDFAIAPNEVSIVHKVFSSKELPSHSSIENLSVGTFMISDTRGDMAMVDLTILRHLDKLSQINRVIVVVDIRGSMKIKGKTHEELLVNSLRKVFTGPQAISNKDYSICLNGSTSLEKRGETVALFFDAVAECVLQNAAIKEITLGYVLSRDVEHIIANLSKKEPVSYLERLVCTRKGENNYNDDVDFHEFCNVLATFISQNKVLKELCVNVIPKLKIDSSGISIIASALEHNTTLQKLTLIPKQLYFERNSETGVMELTSSKLKWSLTSSTVQCQSKGKKRLQNVVHNVSDIPPAKRPHDDSTSSIYNATEDALTSPQSIPQSDRPEMSTLSTISCHSLQVSAHAYSLAGPSQVPYPTPSSGRDCATGHHVMSNQTQVVYSRAVSHELSVSQSNRPITTAPINHRQSPEPQKSRHSLTGSSHSLCSLSSVDGDTAGYYTSQMLDQTVQQSLPHQQHVPTPCDISTLGHHSNLIHDHDTSHDHTVAQHYQPGMSSLCQQPLPQESIHCQPQTYKVNTAHASYQHPTDIRVASNHSARSCDEPIGQPQSLATDPLLPISSQYQPREQGHSTIECSSIGATCSFGEPPQSTTTSSSLEHYSVLPHSMPYHVSPEIAGVPQPIGGSSFVAQAPTSRNLPQERPPAYPHYAYPQMFPAQAAVPMGYPFPVPWPSLHYQMPPPNQQQVYTHQMYSPSQAAQPGAPYHYIPMPWPYPYQMQAPHHQQPTTSSQSVSTTTTTNSSTSSSI